MSYQKMKHKRLIYTQIIMDVKVHLESYLEVRKQMSQMSWKLVYDIDNYSDLSSMSS